MTRERLLDYLPPCGLVCYTCAGFADGAIKEHSEALVKYWEGFREFLDARTTDQNRHRLEAHDRFIERLKKDSAPPCPGCRKIDGKGPGCIKGCLIPQCIKEHGVDFCANCNEFPCAKMSESDVYDEGLKKAFYERGLQIKEIGAKKFFEIYKDVPHYLNSEK